MRVRVPIIKRVAPLVLLSMALVFAVGATPQGRGRKVQPIPSIPRAGVGVGARQTCAVL
jgi:hypothetical protein